MKRALFASVLALAACATGGGPANGAWVAVSANTDLRFGQPYPTLVIDGGRVSGTGGCNRYSGDVVITGQAINVTNLASTEMACSPAIMEQERLFLTLLGDADAISPESDIGQLILRTPDARILRLRSASPQ